MTHFVNLLFFVAVLLGSIALMALMVRGYWSEIRSALVGEVPARHTQRPWVARVRVSARPRPQAARSAQRRAAA